MPTGGGGGTTFNAATPGAIGGTTSNTGQFTNVAIGASVPTLDGTTGDLTISGALATGGQATDGTAGDITIARTGANADGVINVGVGTHQVSINTTTDAGANKVLVLPTQINCGGVYFRVRSGLVFSNLPAASASYEGALASITDSTTAVWGATITGSGTNHVLAYCDGSAWTVAAK